MTALNTGLTDNSALRLKRLISDGTMNTVVVSGWRGLHTRASRFVIALLAVH